MVGPGEYAVAPYFAELIKIATGVGTHTTQVLRLLAFVKNGGKVPEAEEIKELCVDGYLGWQRVSEKCAGIEEPVRRGLKTYFVVRSAIADLCPDVMRILAESDHAKHANFQRVSFIESMHNIHRRRCLPLLHASTPSVSDVPIS